MTQDFQTQLEIAASSRHPLSLRQSGFMSGPSGFSAHTRTLKPRRSRARHPACRPQRPALLATSHRLTPAPTGLRKIPARSGVSILAPVHKSWRSHVLLSAWSRQKPALFAATCRRLTPAPTGLRNIAQGQPSLGEATLGFSHHAGKQTQHPATSSGHQQRLPRSSATPLPRPPHSRRSHFPQLASSLVTHPPFAAYAISSDLMESCFRMFRVFRRPSQSCRH